MALNRYFGAALLTSLIAATTLAAPSAQAAATSAARACHQKFTAAKKAGTLNGQKYKDFKAAQCADMAAPAAATPTATAPAPSAPAPTAAAPAAAPAPATPAASIAPKSSIVSSGNVVFPTGVAAQYAKLSPGKARMKTCVDQYNANKSSGGNGSLKWIQKGGGYWSECNTKLKS